MSDIIKPYAELILGCIKEGNTEIQLDLDYESLPLMDLRVPVTLSDHYHGLFDPRYSTIKEGRLYNVFLRLTLNENDLSDSKILGIISHELTHAKEYFEIQKKNLHMTVKIHPVHVDVKIINQDHIGKFPSFSSFRNLVYLSLDDEMNARIAQIYHYLYEFGIRDASVLTKKVRLHDSWEYVMMLQSFDSEEFVRNNLELVGIGGFLSITNSIIEKFVDMDLNVRSKMLKFVHEPMNTCEDLYRFYGRWEEYFRRKADLHVEKFDHLISEVIEDLNGNRPFNEWYRCSIHDPIIRPKLP